MAQKFITPITIKQLASAGSDALTVFVDGEVYGRVKVEAGGRISWSSGTGVYDTNLYRDGANTLVTDDVLKAISGVVTLATNGAPTAALPDGAIAVDTLNNAFYFRSNATWTQVTGGGGGASVTVSDNPPASPTEGDLWFESDTAKTHVYYDSFWVEIGAGGGVATLDNIGDVTAPTPTSGDFLKWNGTAWVNDAIDLGTDTTGNYVATLTAGTGITLANNTGEGASPTVTVDTAVIQARVTNVTDTEIGYLDGVTSAIQTQIDAKAPLASPTFTGTVTLPDNTVALGTKTTGDYVATITGGTGVTSTAATTGEGTTHTLSIGQAVATTDNVTFAGVTADAIKIGVTAANEIDTTSGNLTIDSAGGTVTVDDNLVVSGNLTVSGTTTSINTETLTVDDNIIVLNNNVTASPTENAGIEVERGTSTNVLIRWNETSDKWEFTNDGSTYSNLGAGGATVSDTAPASPTAGQIWFNSANAKTFVYYDSSWVEVGVTAGVSVLDDLTNVTAPSPTSGQFLKWNGTAWVPDSIPTINALDDIGNVTAPSPSVNDVLQWNGTAWVNSASAGGGLTISASAPASPSAGDMWFDSDTSKTYVYYDSYWVEVGNIGGTAKVLVSAEPPASPTLGDLWFDSDTAQTFAYYDSSWVEVGATGTAAVISDTAPGSPISGLIWFNSATGQTFTYYDSQWIEIGASGVAAFVDSTVPSSPIIGQIWFNSTTGGTYVYYDTVWVEIGAQPLSTIISTIDQKGDILVGSGDNAITKISAAADSYVLTTNSTTATGLQWVSRSDVARDFEIASIMGVY